MKKIRQPQVFIPLLIVIFTFVVYAPVLKNDFVNIDDETLIINNPLVNKGKDVKLGEFFEAKKFKPHYKPLTYISWNLEYRIWGNAPKHFHVNNLLLHLMNSVLLFFIALKIFSILFKKKSRFKNLNHIFAAVISLGFAIHPMHVESVAWAVERKDVLYSFFFLGGLLCYLHYLETKKIQWILFSIALYCCNILTKSMGITLVLFIIMIDIYYHRSFSKKSLLRFAGFVGIFFLGLYLYGLFTNFSKSASGITAGIAIQTDQALPEKLEKLPPFIARILIINIRFFLWLTHSIIPAKSSVIYPRFDILEKTGSMGFFFMLFNVFTFLVLLIKRKKLGALLFGFLFFAFSLFPALAISDRGISVFLSDRYLYIASTGVFIMLFYLFLKLAEKNKKISYLYLPFIIAGIVFSLYTRKLVKV